MDWNLTAPLTKDTAAKLRAGDSVRISGVIYAARDAAHKKMCECIATGVPLPFPVVGSVLYYMGPSPAQPGMALGAAGPTTSYRMDAYAPTLLDLGSLGMIGKGSRNDEVIASIRNNGAVYFAATGGAGALLSRCILSAEVIAWPELGAEALRRLEVRNLPAVVVIDSLGDDLYKLGPQRYLAEHGGI